MVHPQHDPDRFPYGRQSDDIGDDALAGCLGRTGRAVRDACRAAGDGVDGGREDGQGGRGSGVDARGVVLTAWVEVHMLGVGVR